MEYMRSKGWLNKEPRPILFNEDEAWMDGWMDGIQRYDEQR